MARKWHIKISINIILILGVLIMGVVLINKVKRGIETGEFDEGVAQVVNGANKFVDELDKHIDVSYGENTNHTNYDIQYIIDSAQNVIRDSIYNTQSDINYWSSYDTELPTGEVIRMYSYDDSEFKLEGKTSSDYDYGIITIKKDDGTLSKNKSKHEWFLSIKKGDIIR